MHGNRTYTDEQIEYLREISQGRYNDEITKMFNDKFGLDKNVGAIKALKERSKIVSNVSTGKREYTDKMLDYLREITPGRFNREITKMFNKKFGLAKSEKAIKGARAKYRILTEARHEYPKGHVPFNKDTKGLTGENATSFKKGDIPYNYKPVGTERINAEGYIDVKIADPRTWKPKHRIIWEKHNGEIPKNHVILFGDGDKLNVNIDNLLCVSRSQLVRLNQNDMIQNDAELTKTALNIIDLQQKIYQLEKGK